MTPRSDPPEDPTHAGGIPVSEGRFFGLDLIRGGGILAVVSIHALVGRAGEAYRAAVGFFVIEMFFVMSGFLIGTILLNSLAAGQFQNHRDLIHFWARRWLRTLPAYYFYLTLSLLFLSRWLEVGESIPAYFVFLQNFLWAKTPFMGVSWSLTIEEWFYLLLPLAFLAKTAQGRALGVMSLVAFPVLLRLWLPTATHNDFSVYCHGATLTRLDSLIYGVLIAFARLRRPGLWRSLDRFAGAFLALLILTFLYQVQGFPGMFDWKVVQVFFTPLQDLSLACMLPRLCRLQAPTKLIGRGVSLVARISYSMYLSHSLILEGLCVALGIPSPLLLNGFVAVALIIAATLAFSWISYHLIEAPFLRLRDQWVPARRETPSITTSIPPLREIPRPGPPAPQAPSSPVLPRSAFLLPSLIWFMGCLFLLGDLGRHRDDYGWDARDPVSSSYNLSALIPFEWLAGPRPLELYLRAINTVLYPVHEIVVLISALAHAIVSLLLFNLLRRRVHPAAAAMAALLFLSFPPMHEAILWPPGLSTVVGTGLLLGALTLGQTQGGSTTARVPAQLMMLGLCLPLLTEQPALTLVVAAIAGSRAGLSRNLRVAAVLAPLYWLTALALGLPSGRLFFEQWPALSGIPDRVMLVGRQAASTLMLSSLGAGSALLEGVARLSTAGPLLWVLMASLIAGAVTWGRFWIDSVNPSEDRSGDSRNSLRRLGWFVFAGGLVAMIPRGNEWLTSRHLYVPVAGFSCVVAVWLDEYLAWCRKRERGARWALPVFLSATSLVLVFCLMLVGVQSWLAERHRSDQAQLERLRVLVPRPAAGTVFIPLRVEDETLTAAPPVDGLPGVFENHEGLTRELMRVYRRNDVGGVGLNRWVGLRPAEIDSDGVRTFAPAWMGPVLPTADSEGERRFAWSQVIPFAVDRSGTVHRVSEVVLEQSDLQDTVVQLSGASPSSLAHEIGLTSPVSEGRTKPVGPWLWSHSPFPVSFTPSTSLGGRQSASVFIPGPKHLSTSRIVTKMPPSEGLETLCFRLAPFDARSLAALEGGQIRLDIAVAGQSVFSMNIPVRRLSRAPRWLPLAVPLPRRSSMVDLSIAMESPPWNAPPLLISEPRLRPTLPSDFEPPMGRWPPESWPNSPPSKPEPTYPPYPWMAGLMALSVTFLVGSTVQGGLRLPRQAGLIATLLVLIPTRWTQMGAYPTGLDNGNWLVLGQKLMGEASRFDLYSAHVFPPLVPILMYLGDVTLGVLLGTKAVGLAAVAGVVIGVYTIARASMARGTAAAAALLVGSAFPVTEALAFGGYPQCMALAFLLFGLHFHARALAGDGRRVQWLAATFLSLAGLAHHAYFVAGITVVIAATALWAMVNRRDAGPRRTLGRLARAVVVPLFVFLPTAVCMVVEGYQPNVNAGQFEIMGSVRYALREPLWLWLTVLGSGIASLCLKSFWSSRNDAALCAAALGATGGVSFLMTGEPRLVPLVLIAGSVGAGLLFEAALRGLPGQRSRRATTCVALAACAWLWYGSEREARAVFPWYRTLDADYLETAAWVKSQRRSDITAINQGLHGEPIGWWFQPLTETPLAIGSDPRWLAFPRQFDRAASVASVFDRRLAWREAAQKGREHGLGLLVTRKVDWPNWEAWSRTAGLAVAFQNSEFIVFDARGEARP